MIKLIAIEPQGGTSLLLRFSDGAWGLLDCAWLLAANTEMTAPLRDAEFFSRHFIESGALAWPNGLDLSGHSLHRRLEESGDLHRNAAAA